MTPAYSVYFDVSNREKKLHLHHLPLLKTHLPTRHCLSAVIHHGGFELLMEAASVSRPLSMIHSLSPSVSCPLLLPSLPPYPCSPRPSSSSLMDARRPRRSREPQSEQQIAKVSVVVNPQQTCNQLCFPQSHSGAGTSAGFNFQGGSPSASLVTLEAFRPLLEALYSCECGLKSDHPRAETVTRGGGLE